MKKLLLASVAILVLAGGAGGWYVLHQRNPLQEAKTSLSRGDFRSANLQLRTAVQDDPNNAEGHSLLAQLQLASDDPIAAEQEIKKAMSLGADKAQSLAVLSQAYQRQRKWKEILADIPEQGATKAQTAFFLTTRAAAEQGVGKVDDAAKLLQQAEALAPENVDVHVAAARFDFDTKHPDEAMAQIDRALVLDPQRVDARMVKAGLLAAKGDQQAAIGELDRAVQLAPKRDDVLLQRAVLLTTTNQDKKAQADVDQLLTRKPPLPQAQYLQVVLLTRANKFAEADPILQTLDPVIARLPRGLYFKALVKLELGRLAQAEDAILQYTAGNPQDADGVRLLGTIELANKRPARAIPQVVKAVGAGQNDPQTLSLLARLYTADGKPAEAERVLQQASTTSNPQQLTQLASARLQVGDLSGAATDLQRAVDNGANQPGAQEVLITTAIRLGQLDRAQAALDALKQQAGETEVVGNLTGLLFVARLEPESALKAFKDTAARFPNSFAARINEARVLLQLNRVGEAIDVLKGVLDKTPTQTDALALISQLLLAQNRGQEAVDYAEKAHKAKPDDVGLVNGEAQLLGRTSQYDKGIDLIETMRKDGKVPPPLLATLGSLQLAAGKTDAAKESFAALVAAEPNNVAAVLGDADLLNRVKDYDGARKLLNDALGRMPQSLPLLQARVRVDLVDKGPDVAVQTAERLRAEPGHMPDAATLVGGLLMGQQRFADAAKAFQSEYDKTPTAALAIALAEAQQAGGRPTDAIATLTKFQATKPDDAAVALLLSSLEISARQLDPAERNLGIVLRQQPNNPAALNNLAWIYRQRGDKRALETARRAFEQAPTPDVADTLGWIMVGQGDSQRALPLLQQAAAGAPQNPSIRYHLAVALKNTGKPADAQAALKPVLDGSAQFDERSQAEKLMAELNNAKP